MAWHSWQPLSQHPLPSARCLPHLLILIHPNNEPGKKTKNSKMRSCFQKIESYCLGLHTQNPDLREVDLKTSPKTGSDKIKMEKQGRNTQKKASCIVQPGLMYGSEHLEK